MHTSVLVGVGLYYITCTFTVVKYIGMHMVRSLQGASVLPGTGSPIHCAKAPSLPESHLTVSAWNNYAHALDSRVLELFAIAYNTFGKNNNKNTLKTIRMKLRRLKNFSFLREHTLRPPRLRASSSWIYCGVGSPPKMFCLHAWYNITGALILVLKAA